MLSAGSFEDFKRSQAGDFKQYKDERDTAFNNYLKSKWKLYQEKQGISIYEEPKPKKIPTAKSQPIENVGPKVNIKIKKVKPIVIQKKIEVKKVEVVEKNTKLTFFGTAFGFNISNDIKTASFFPRNQNGITSFFEILASSKHEDIVENIKKIQTDLNLNDWGTYLLVLELSKQIYSEDDNANIFSWFVFNKLGYAVKIGLVNKHVVLLHYSKK